MSRASFCVYSIALISLCWLTTGCTPEANPPGKPGDAQASGDKASGDKKTSEKTAGDKGTKRFVLLINNDSPYWETGRAGMYAAAKDLKLADAGYEAVFQTNDGTASGQINQLRQFATQPDIVGLAISPIKADNVAIVEEVRKLRKNGVHVVCMDSDFDRAKFRDAREFYLGTDNVQGGRVLAAAAKKLLGTRKVEQGGYIQFVGDVGAQNAMERMNGFKEALGSSYNEIERKVDGGKDGVRTAVRTALINHPDLVALIGIWSYDAPAIADVVGSDPAKRSQITVATFDAEPGALQGMSKGLIDVMVVQDPFDICFEATKILKALCENDQATVKKMFPKAGAEGGDQYDTALKVVVPDEKSPITADVFKEKFGDSVQFLTLPAFQQWLKKYGLTGS